MVELMRYSCNCIKAQKVPSLKMQGGITMYLDPGFGGMLVQIVIALLAAGGALLFAMRKKIKGLFSKNKASSNKRADTAPAKEVVDMLDKEAN